MSICLLFLILNSIKDHPINNSEYLEFNTNYRIEEGKIEPFTNFFDLNNLDDGGDSQFKKSCYMGMDEMDPNDPTDDNPIYKD